MQNTFWVNLLEAAKSFPISGLIDFLNSHLRLLIPTTRIIFSTQEGNLAVFRILLRRMKVECGKIQSWKSGGMSSISQLVRLSSPMSNVLGVPCIRISHLDCGVVGSMRKICGVDSRTEDGSACTDGGVGVGW